MLTTQRIFNSNAPHHCHTKPKPSYCAPVTALGGHGRRLAHQHLLLLLVTNGTSLTRRPLLLHCPSTAATGCRLCRATRLGPAVQRQLSAMTLKGNEALSKQVKQEQYKHAQPGYAKEIY